MDEKQRIEKIIEMENLSSSEFAKEINELPSKISHILKDRNRPTLDVLKKILIRYPAINPEWLIMGIGSMYRQEKKGDNQIELNFDLEDSNKSVSSLFDNTSVVRTETAKSDNINKIAIESEPVSYPDSHKLREFPQNSHQITETDKGILTEKNSKPGRSVCKIIIYYDDNTFQEFESK